MSDGVLVGDVGGTNVRFAIVRRDGDALRVEAFRKFQEDEADSFETALGTYVEDLDERPSRACFALAGPVRDGEVFLTNRRWRVSANEVKAAFGFTDVRLINDFTAMARSVPEIGFEHLESIIPGASVEGAPILVAGPGTGFGVATLLQTDVNTWVVLNGEGGHAAFAPRDQLEVQLTEILLRDHGYVSNELVASGSGLPVVHKAFCEIYDRQFEDLSPQKMHERAKSGDAMFDAIITVRALTVMSAIGDMVLANGALGGVVLAGGVTERIAHYLKTDTARARFEQRGSLSKYIQNCPVHLMVDPNAPLIGAAAFYEQEQFQ